MSPLVSYLKTIIFYLFRDGNKIKLDIIEENIILKNWYAANGFVHIGTKKFEHLPFTVGFMEWEAAK